MKAAVYKNYGKPSVVSIANIDKPTPKENEILIKISYATVNRTDAGFRSAEYLVSRFWSGLFHPKFPVLGCEFSGIIESCGKEVTLFKIGEAVFGYNDLSFGGHAEYICIAEKSAVAHIPNSLSLKEAAPLTEGAHYALSIINAIKIKEGNNILVYGATGAIGSAAVQILKHLGAHVTAVCNSKNISLVQSLGADSVIDYQKEDFTAIPDQFDAIMDAVGKSSFGACKHLLKEKGIYVSTELGKRGENIWYALLTPLFGRKKVLFPIPTMNKSIILILQEMAAMGKLKAVIDKTYPLDQIVAAHTYVDSGQKTGNVLIQISD